MIMDAGEESAARRRAGQGGEALGESGHSDPRLRGRRQRQRRQRDQHLAFAGAENLLEGQMAFAFLGFEIAFGQKPAEPAVSRAIGRIGEHLETIDGDEPHADDELDAFRFFASS